MPVDVPARAATTVILLREHAAALELLMLRRPATGGFASGAGVLLGAASARFIHPGDDGYPSDRYGDELQAPR